MSRPFFRYDRSRAYRRFKPNSRVENRVFYSRAESLSVQNSELRNLNRELISQLQNAENTVEGLNITCEQLQDEVEGIQDKLDSTEAFLKLQSELADKAIGERDAEENLRLETEDELEDLKTTLRKAKITFFSDKEDLQAELRKEVKNNAILEANLEKAVKESKTNETLASDFAIKVVSLEIEKEKCKDIVFSLEKMVKKEMLARDRLEKELALAKSENVDSKCKFEREVRELKYEVKLLKIEQQTWKEEHLKFKIFVNKVANTIGEDEVNMQNESSPELETLHKLIEKLDSLLQRRRVELTELQKANELKRAIQNIYGTTLSDSTSSSAGSKAFDNAASNISRSMEKPTDLNVPLKIQTRLKAVLCLAALRPSGDQFSIYPNINSKSSQRQCNSSKFRKKTPAFLKNCVETPQQPIITNGPEREQSIDDFIDSLLLLPSAEVEKPFKPRRRPVDGGLRKLRQQVSRRQHHTVQLIMSRQKLYKCSCGTKCASRSALNRHIQYFTSEWKFQCKYCPEKYLSLSYLKTHLRNTHQINNPYKMYISGCRFCGIMFKSREEYLIHRKLNQ